MESETTRKYLHVLLFNLKYGVRAWIFKIKHIIQPFFRFRLARTLYIVIPSMLRCVDLCGLVAYGVIYGSGLLSSGNLTYSRLLVKALVRILTGATSFNPISGSNQNSICAAFVLRAKKMYAYAYSIFQFSNAELPC